MKFHTLWLLVLVVLWSCRRQNDEEPPRISFIQPAAGINVSAFDTLRLVIKVSDNEMLSECGIRVVNSALVPVFPEVVQSLSGREDTVRMNYVLNDARVPSGTCYIEVRVSDGPNNARQYRQIQFAEAPLQLLGLCYATQNTSNQTGIYRCDTSWQPQLISQQPGVCSDVAVSNWWQQVYMSTGNSGILRAEPLENTASSWQVNIPQGPPTAWSSIYEHNRRIWAAQFGDELIRAFDQAGTSVYNVACGAGMRPYKLGGTGRYVVAAEHDAPQAVKQLEVFDILTGAAIHFYPLTIDVVAIEPVDSVSVFVYGNSAGQGYAYLYNCLTNTAWQPYTIASGLEVRGACRVDGNTQLLSMSNGTVQKFTLNPLGMIPWLTATQPGKINYDVVNNQVFIADGTSIGIYQYTNAQWVRSINTTLPVVNFELWHNR
ncbi:MAG: hypothetical protein MUC87_22055 [Bacteroidia bacterium]|jgi:hypothetical protein|nr:hypothetical protein [Bacteroidia bacterium]